MSIKVKNSGISKTLVIQLNKATRHNRQGNFRTKEWSGVDAGSGFVHTIEATAANVHDITVA